MRVHSWLSKAGEGCCEKLASFCACCVHIMSVTALKKIIHRHTNIHCVVSFVTALLNCSHTEAHINSIQLAVAVWVGG